MNGGKTPTRSPASATTDTLLDWSDESRRGLLDPSIVDVSHAEGVPIGTLGSGHSVFGRNGFSRVAFSGPPDMGPRFDELRFPAAFAFFLSEGNCSYVLQETAPLWRNRAGRFESASMERVLAFAELPKAHYRFEHATLELDLAMSAYSPLIAHDINTSSIPVQVFEITVRNRATRARRLEVRLSHAEAMTVHASACRLVHKEGQIAFAPDGGDVDRHGAYFELEVDPGGRRTVRFIVAWYFPEFRTPSPAAPAVYRRYYAQRYENALDVARLALECATKWSLSIDEWRASFEVPPEMKRLWFSSLSSVITSTMLSDDPYFFAIEAPHDWVNTMDVAVYANWVYLVNWPELERMDLNQHLSIVSLEGEKAGFVCHSQWNDASHYAEEPTFLTRLWRAHRWFNDTAWLRGAALAAHAAANYAHRHESFEHLLSSQQGNQSYDEWMMPGVSSYVNVAWLYALHALSGIGHAVGASFEVGGIEVTDLIERVRANLLRWLWSYQDHGYFRCFHRTPESANVSVEDTVFTDQLFGRWVLGVDESASTVLADGYLTAALSTIYETNLLEDRGTGFRGWANGVLPGGRVDVISGYHARTCWLGAQINLASLLGSVGDETRSLDVFRSIEKSLGMNHLAVGEWNRAIDAKRRAVVLDEWGKDTPRFPPYPRYTSSWEYLVRILGLTMDEDNLYLHPFRSLRFALRGVSLAGALLSVRVEPNWKRALVAGAEVGLPVTLRRDIAIHSVEFVAG